MRRLRAETIANAEAFIDNLGAEIASATKKLQPQRGIFIEAYQHVVSLQAWRRFIIEKKYQDHAAAFFREAQNDALVSLMLASFGAWRPALQCLRSTIEGTLACLYYAQHEVELVQWQNGKHTLSLRGYCQYFEEHPNIAGATENIKVTELIGNELRELSKAVHASQLSYRMTAKGFPCLVLPDKVLLKMWSKRHCTAITAINLLVTCFHRQCLKDTRTSELRKCLSLVFPAGLKKRVETEWGIRLFK